MKLGLACLFIVVRNLYVKVSRQRNKVGAYSLLGMPQHGGQQISEEKVSNQAKQLFIAAATYMAIVGVSLLSISPVRAMPGGKWQIST
jgi:hypothetical protein